MKQGARSLRGLGRVFRLLDSWNGKNSVSTSDFKTGLSKIGVSLTS